MKRREFTTQLAATGLGLAAVGGAAIGSVAHAQTGAPVEGQHFVRLSQRVPVAAPAGKLEVIEFFWYGCPHCNAFEPALEAWVKRLPADVAFRRVHVAFRPEPFEAHQKIYYTLEAMGQVEAMHRKVFFAIHNERQRLDKLPDIAAWASKNGLDGARFTEIANSFAIQSKLRQARQLSDAYKIDGVPALGVHGRFYTSGALAGTPERALAVTDWLLARLRQEK